MGRLRRGAAGAVAVAAAAAACFAGVVASGAVVVL